MGKLKKTWAEIMEHFDWKRFILGLCSALAIVSFFLGIVLAIVFDSLAYLALLFVGIVVVAFIMGVEGEG